MLSFLLLAFTTPFLVAQNSPASSGKIADGRKLFTSTCASCHGLDGRGGEHAPDIATNNTTRRRSDADLLHIVSAGIPADGMPAFATAFSSGEIQAVVKYLRELQGGIRTSVSGNPEHGRAVFFGSSRCSQCHMIRGAGGFLAADLSGFGSAHTEEEIREAILAPDKNFDSRRGTVTVTNKHGDSLTGVIRNEDNFSVQIQTTDGEFHSFDKGALASIVRQKRSGMPTDYDKRLTQSDLNDLIAFLVTNSAPKSKTSEVEDE